jgi:CRISPR-associated protein Cmr5
MSRQRSLEQERASKAWNCITYVRDKGSKYAKEYASLARSAPAYIQANGLGQTLAFWRAKGYDKGKPRNDDEHSRLLQDLSAWITSQLNITGRADLVAWICNEASVSEYRRATAEAIAFLSWVKRFAEAELAEAKGA